MANRAILRKGTAVRRKAAAAMVRLRKVAAMVRLRKAAAILPKVEAMAVRLHKGVATAVRLLVGVGRSSESRLVRLLTSP